MFCPKCGNELKEQDKFCPKCGQENASYREGVAAPKAEDSFFFAPSQQTSQPQNEFRPEGSTFDYTPNTDSSNDFSQYGSQPAPAEDVEENPIFAKLGLILSIFGLTPGLVLCIIGLIKYKNPQNRRKCKLGIGFIIGWCVVGFFLGIVLGMLGMM